MKHLSLEKKIFLIILLGLIFRIYLFAIIPVWEVPDEIAHYKFVEYVAKHNQLPVMIRAYVEYFQPPAYYILQGSILKPFLKSPITLQVHILRILSILFGLLTIFMTYKIAKIMFPANEKVIVASAAFVAFLPSFINMNVGITDANMADFMSSLVIFLVLKMIYRKTSTKDYVLLGIVCGLALLTRINTIPAVAAALIGIFLKAKENKKFDLMNFIRICFIVYGIAFIISFWWFIRNFVLYGDLIGFNAMKMASPQDYIVVNSVFAARLLGWTFVTFWASFGKTNGIFIGSLNSIFGSLIFAITYFLLLAVALISIYGLHIFYKQYKKNNNLLSGVQKKSFVIILFHILLLVFTFVRFNLYDFQPQGRLLFPLIYAAAIAFSFGTYTLFVYFKKENFYLYYLGYFILLDIASLASITYHF